MLSDLHHVISLMRGGRFLEAVSQIRKLPVRLQDPKYELHSALLAELLHLTGETGSAERLSEDLCKNRGAKATTLARAHIVLGNIRRDRGNLSQAIFHFEKACRLADDCQNHELACWARLRLMAAAGERDGPAVAVGMLPDIRSRVTALGDPIVLATLHFWVAEFESKRGLLLSASRHIQSGRAILKEHNNVWLQGSAAIDDFCISFLRSDIDSALAHASDALQAARLSGHATTKMAACTNLAHIHLTHGDFENAESYFNGALTCCQSGGANEIAVLDGLAQLELARGELSSCQEYLDKIGHIEKNSVLNPNYYESWSFRTRVQLLIKQGKFDDGIRFLRDIPVPSEGFHPALRLTLQTLSAELLFITGDHGAAGDLIHSAYAEYDGQSPDVLAEIERTLAKILGGLNERRLAAWHFKRAISILSVIDNVVARAAAIRDCSAVFPSSRCDERSFEHSNNLDLVVDGNELGVSNADSCLISRVAALFESSNHPQLLGGAALDLLTELGCAKQLLLKTEGNEDTNEIIAPRGDEPRDTEWINGGNPDRLRIFLGSARGRNHALLVVPKSDLASRLSCSAVQKVIDTAVELENLRREANERSAIWPVDEFFSSGEAVFAAPPMVQIVKTIRKIAPSNVTVLLTGETGTGKEILARALHDNSNRANKPFLPFNCAAIPRELVESQLFGYRRGAFSGAHEHFDGIIRGAAGGTLFLDEIGEVAQEVQPKLLRFLESGEIHPLGEAKPIKIDVRVIAASNADLDQLVARNQFREDLFYRLNVIRFKIPALRERREEIPLLVHYFLKKYSAESLKPGLSIAEEAMEHFVLYHWPGNVRQLANEIKRLVALAENGALLTAQHLSPEIAATRNTVPSTSKHDDHKEIIVRLDQSLDSAVEQLERSMLQYALHESGGRVEVAAKGLGVSRKGLYLKRQRLGVQLPS